MSRPPAARPGRETIMEALLAALAGATQTEFTADTQVGSKTLFNPSAARGFFKGLPVFGKVIPDGAIITSVSPLTISQAPTANVAGAQLSTGFVTAERRAQFTRDVPCPALLLRSLEEENEWQDDVVPVLMMKAEACIISNAGADPDVVPETALHNFLDALDAAMKPDSGDIRFTLGGLVYWCRMRGKVDKSPGDLGPQGIAYTDIEIIVP